MSSSAAGVRRERTATSDGNDNNNKNNKNKNVHSFTSPDIFLQGLNESILELKKLTLQGRGVMKAQRELEIEYREATRQQQQQKDEEKLKEISKKVNENRQNYHQTSYALVQFVPRFLYFYFSGRAISEIYDKDYRVYFMMGFRFMIDCFNQQFVVGEMQVMKTSAAFGDAVVAASNNNNNSNNNNINNEEYQKKLTNLQQARTAAMVQQFTTIQQLFDLLMPTWCMLIRRSNRLVSGTSWDDFVQFVQKNASSSSSSTTTQNNNNNNNRNNNTIEEFTYFVRSLLDHFHTITTSNSYTLFIQQIASWTLKNVINTSNNSAENNATSPQQENVSISRLLEGYPFIDMLMKQCNNNNNNNSSSTQRVSEDDASAANDSNNNNTNTSNENTSSRIPSHFRATDSAEESIVNLISNLVSAIPKSNNNLENSRNSKKEPTLIRHYPPLHFFLSQNKFVPERISPNNNNNNNNNQTVTRFKLNSVPRATSSSTLMDSFDHNSFSVNLTLQEANQNEEALIIFRTIFLFLHVLTSSSNTNNNNNNNNNQSTNDDIPEVLQPNIFETEKQGETDFANAGHRVKPFIVNPLDRLSPGAARKLLRCVILTLEKLYEKNRINQSDSASSYTFLIEQYSVVIAKLMQAFTKNGFNLSEERAMLSSSSSSSSSSPWFGQTSNLAMKPRSTAIVGNSNPCGSLLSIIHHHYFSELSSRSSARTLPCFPQTSALIEKLLFGCGREQEDNTNVSHIDFLKEILQLLDFVTRQYLYHHHSDQQLQFVKTWTQIVNEEILSRFLSSSSSSQNNRRKSPLMSLKRHPSLADALANSLSVSSTSSSSVTDLLLTPVIKGLVVAATSSSSSSSSSISLSSESLSLAMTIIRYAIELSSSSNHVSSAETRVKDDDDGGSSNRNNKDGHHKSSVVAITSPSLVSTAPTWSLVFSILCRISNLVGSARDKRMLRNFIQDELFGARNVDIRDGALLFIQQQGENLIASVEKDSSSSSFTKNVLQQQQQDAAIASPFLMLARTNTEDGMAKTSSFESQDGKHSSSIDLSSSTLAYLLNNENNGEKDDQTSTTTALSFAIKYVMKILRRQQVSSEQQQEEQVSRDDLVGLHHCFVLINASVESISSASASSSSNYFALTNFMMTSLNENETTFDLLHLLFEQFYDVAAASSSSDSSSTLLLNCFREEMIKISTRLGELVLLTIGGINQSKPNEDDEKHQIMSSSSIMNNSTQAIMNFSKKIADMLFPVASLPFVAQLLVQLDQVNKDENEINTNNANAVDAAVTSSSSKSTSAKNRPNPIQTSNLQQQNQKITKNQKEELALYLECVARIIDGLFLRANSLTKAKQVSYQQNLTMFSSTVSRREFSNDDEGSDADNVDENTTNATTSDLLSSFCGFELCQTADFSFVVSSSSSTSAKTSFSNCLSLFLQNWKKLSFDDTNKNTITMNLRLFSAFCNIIHHSDSELVQQWLEAALQQLLLREQRQENSSSSSRKGLYFKELSALDPTCMLFLIREFPTTTLSSPTSTAQQTSTTKTPASGKKARGGAKLQQDAAAAPNTTTSSSSLSSLLVDLFSPCLVTSSSSLSSSSIFAQMSLQQLLLFGLATARAQLTFENDLHVEVLCQQHLLSSKLAQSVFGNNPLQYTFSSSSPRQNNNHNNLVGSGQSPKNHTGSSNSIGKNQTPRLGPAFNPPSMFNINNNSTTSPISPTDITNNNSSSFSLSSGFNFSSFVTDFGHTFLDKVAGYCGNVFVVASMPHRHEAALSEMNKTIRALCYSGTMLSRLVLQTIVTAACQHIFGKCRIVEERANTNTNNNNNNTSSRNSLVIDALTTDPKLRCSIQLIRTVVDVYSTHVSSRGAYDWLLTNHQRSSAKMNQTSPSDSPTSATNSNSLPPPGPQQQKAGQTDSNNQRLTEREEAMRRSICCVCSIFRLFPTILVDYFSTSAISSPDAAASPISQQSTESAGRILSSPNFFPGVSLGIKLLADCPGCDDELFFAALAETTLFPVVAAANVLLTTNEDNVRRVSVNEGGQQQQNKNTNNNDNNNDLTVDPIQDFYFNMYNSSPKKYMITTHMGLKVNLANALPQCIAELTVETVVEYLTAATLTSNQNQHLATPLSASSSRRNYFSNNGNNTNFNNNSTSAAASRLYYNDNAILERLATRFSNTIGTNLSNLASWFDKSTGAACNFTFMNSFDRALSRTMIYGPTTTKNFQENFETQLDITSAAIQSGLMILEQLPILSKRFDRVTKSSSTGQQQQLALFDACCRDLAKAACKEIHDTLRQETQEQDGPRLLRFNTVAQSIGNTGTASDKAAMRVGAAVIAFFDILTHQVGFEEQQNLQTMKRNKQQQRMRMMNLQRSSTAATKSNSQQRTATSKSNNSFSRSASSSARNYNNSSIDLSSPPAFNGIFFAPNNTLPASSLFNSSLSSMDNSSDISPITGARKSATCQALTALTILTRMVGDKIKIFSTRILVMIDHVLDGFSSASSSSVSVSGSSATTSETVLLGGAERSTSTEDEIGGNQNQNTSSTTSSVVDEGDHDVEIRVCWLWRNFMTATRTVSLHEDEVVKSCWLSWILHMIDTCRRISSCSKPNSSCRVFMLEAFSLLFQRLARKDLDCIGALFGRCHSVVKQAYETVRNELRKAAEQAAKTVNVDADDDDDDEVTMIDKDDLSIGDMLSGRSSTKKKNSLSSSKKDPILFLHPRTVIGFVVFHMLSKSSQTVISQRLLSLGLCQYLRARTSSIYSSSLAATNAREEEELLLLRQQQQQQQQQKTVPKTNAARKQQQLQQQQQQQQYQKDEQQSLSTLNNNKKKFPAAPLSIFQQIVEPPKPDTYPLDDGSEMYVMRTSESEFARNLIQRHDRITRNERKLPKDDQAQLLQDIYRLPVHELVAFLPQDLHQRSFSLLHQLVKLLLQTCHNAPNIYSLECIGLISADQGFSSDSGLVAAFAAGQTGGTSSGLTQDDLSLLMMYGTEWETRYEFGQSGISRETGGFFSSPAVLAAAMASRAATAVVSASLPAPSAGKRSDPSASSSSITATTNSSSSLFSNAMNGGLVVLSSSSPDELRSRLSLLEPLTALTRTPYQQLSHIQLWEKRLFSVPTTGQASQSVSNLLKQSAEAIDPIGGSGSSTAASRGLVSTSYGMIRGEPNCAGFKAVKEAVNNSDQLEEGSNGAFRVERFKRWDELGKFCLELAVESLEGNGEKQQHDAASFACQELMRVLALQCHFLQGRVISDPTKKSNISQQELLGYDWFTALPPRTQTALLPFTEDNFKNIMVKQPKNAPFFTPGMDYKSWITLFFAQLCYRTCELSYDKNTVLQQEVAAEDPNSIVGLNGARYAKDSTILSANLAVASGAPVQAKIFMAIRLLAKFDHSVSLSLLPYLVAHIVVFGTKEDIENIRLEFDTILNYALGEQQQNSSNNNSETNTTDAAGNNNNTTNTASQTVTSSSHGMFNSSSNLLNLIESQHQLSAFDSNNSNENQHALFNVVNNTNNKKQQTTNEDAAQSDSTTQQQKNNNIQESFQQQQRSLRHRAEQLSLHLAAIFQVLDSLDILMQSLQFTARTEKHLVRTDPSANVLTASSSSMRRTAYNQYDVIYRYCISNYSIADLRCKSFLQYIGNIRPAKAAMLVGNAARALRYLESESVMPSLPTLKTRVLHNQFMNHRNPTTRAMIENSSYHFFLHECFASLDDLDTSKAVFHHARMPIKDAALAEFRHGDWQTALRLCEVTIQQLEKEEQENYHQNNMVMSMNARRNNNINNRNEDDAGDMMNSSYYHQHDPATIAAASAEHADVALFCMRELGYYSSMAKTSSDLLTAFKNKNSSSSASNHRHHRQTFQRHLTDAKWRMSTWSSSSSSSSAFSMNNPFDTSNNNRRILSPVSPFGMVPASQQLGAASQKLGSSLSSSPLLFPTTSVPPADSSNLMMMMSTTNQQQQQNGTSDNSSSSSLNETIFKEYLTSLNQQRAAKRLLLLNNSKNEEMTTSSSSSSHINCLIATAMSQTTAVLSSAFSSSPGSSTSSSTITLFPLVSSLRSTITSGRAKMLSNLKKVQQESQSSLYNDLVSLHLLEDLQLVADQAENFWRQQQFITSSDQHQDGSGEQGLSSVLSASSPSSPSPASSSLLLLSTLENKRKFASNLASHLDLRLQSLDTRFAERVLAAHRNIYQALNSEERYVRLWLGQAENLQRAGQLDAAKNAVSQVVASCEKYLLDLVRSSNNSSSSSSSTIRRQGGASSSSSSSSFAERFNKLSSEYEDDLKNLYWRGKLLEAKLLHDSSSSSSTSSDTSNATNNQVGVDLLSRYISQFFDHNHNNSSNQNNNIANNNNNLGNRQQQQQQQNQNQNQSPSSFPASSSLSSITPYPPLDIVTEMVLLQAQWSGDNGMLTDTALISRLQHIQQLNRQSEALSHVLALYYERTSENLRMKITESAQSMLACKQATKEVKSRNNHGLLDARNDYDISNHPYHHSGGNAPVDYNFVNMFNLLATNTVECIQSYSNSLRLGISNAYLALPRLITTWLDTAAFFAAFLPFQAAGGASHSSSSSSTTTIDAMIAKMSSITSNPQSSSTTSLFLQFINNSKNDVGANPSSSRLFGAMAAPKVDPDIVATAREALANIVKIVHVNLVDVHTMVAPSILIAGLSQLISRVGHCFGVVDDHLHQILFTLMTHYPQQVMWQLVGPESSSGTMSKATRIRTEVFQRYEKTQTNSSRMKPFVKAAREVSRALHHVCTSTSLKNDSRLTQHCPAIKSIIARYFTSPTALTRDQQRQLQAEQGAQSVTTYRLEWILPLTATLTPCLSLSIRSVVFPDLPRIHNFDDEVLVMNSLQKPKRIGILDTNGRKHYFLCKTKDEPRKDMRLLELCGMINTLFNNEEECKRRNLHMRRFQVTPLADTEGMIEWMRNVKPVRSVIEETWGAMRDAMVSQRELIMLKEKIDRREARPETILLNYVYPRFPPRLHVWFHQLASHPPVWYEARRRYTSSLAVWSMVGHEIGLGDRHSENLLMNFKTGEMNHVDFACLFDKGESLQVPEVVRFRLTPNLVDGLGVTGYNGAFEKNCELTISVCMKHRDKFMGVLDTFLYDPLVEWRDTPAVTTAQAAIDSTAANVAIAGKWRNDPRYLMRRVRERLEGNTDLYADRPEFQNALREQEAGIQKMMNGLMQRSSTSEDAKKMFDISNHPWFEVNENLVRSKIEKFPRGTTQQQQMRQQQQFGNRNNNNNNNTGDSNNNNNTMNGTNQQMLLSPQGQVRVLIDNATSLTNISRMYFWWMPWI